MLTQEWCYKAVIPELGRQRQVPGQPGMHSKNLSQKQTNNKTEKYLISLMIREMHFILKNQ
jgi:hypothetical protein